MGRFGVGSLLSSKEFQPVSLVLNFGNYAVPRIVPGHEELLKGIFFFLLNFQSVEDSLRAAMLSVFSTVIRP